MDGKDILNSLLEGHYMKLSVTDKLRHVLTLCATEKGKILVEEGMINYLCQGELDDGKFDFLDIYAAYPRKVGKKIGLMRCKRKIRSEKVFYDVLKAVENYKAYIKTNNVQPSFIKHFSTFMNEWEDWLEYDDGQKSPFEQTRELLIERGVIDKDGNPLKG